MKNLVKLNSNLLKDDQLANVQLKKVTGGHQGFTITNTDGHCGGAVHVHTGDTSN